MADFIYPFDGKGKKGYNHTIPSKRGFRAMQEQKTQGQLPAFFPLEACVLRLRALYERRGFRQVSPSMFEDYTLYLDNKNFLGTERILTFMDPAGRLLTVKPDVTLSIAKSVGQGQLACAEKLYYTDEVVRFSPSNNAYKVLPQIGLERIGKEDTFANLEVIDLALRSLALIGEHSAVDISHLAFVSGLLEDAQLPPDLERELLGVIRAKNIHDAAALLESAGVGGGEKERILTLAALSGPFPQELERAKTLVRGPRMERAYDELSAVANILRPGAGQSVNLDFSVVNDLDYYNGLIFRGYIKGISGVVCAGGRYDNLMKKLGKQSSAIGFAVFLHRLEGYFAKYDRQTDLLITYAQPCDWKALLEKVSEFNRQGLTVRCEAQGVDLSGICYARQIEFPQQGGED